MSYSKSFEITPNDTQDLPEFASGILVLSSGNLSFILTKDDDSETITIPVVSGQIIRDLLIRRVLVSTTAVVRGLRP